MCTLQRVFLLCMKILRYCEKKFDKVIAMRKLSIIFIVSYIVSANFALFVIAFSSAACVQ